MNESAKLQTKCVGPIRQFKIPHLVGYMTTSAGWQYLAVYTSREPKISLISKGEPFRELDLEKPPGDHCVSIDRSGSLFAFAYANDDSLRVRDLVSNREQVVPHQSAIVAVQFDWRGRLWTIRNGSERFVVEVHGDKSWKRFAEVEVSDDYFLEGGAFLSPGPSDDAMFVSAFSGQSEQENYLCSIDNGFLTGVHVSAMDGEQCVFAAPDVSFTVTLDRDECEVARYRHPMDDAPRRLRWPEFDENVDPDDWPGYDGCFVDTNHFLSASSEGRLFLFQLEPFRVLYEIHIAGHEPVPTAEKYPSLKDATGLVSNLVGFGRCGEYVATFFSKDHQKPGGQLVIVRISDLIG